jgi:hypothetical protein
MSRPKKTSIQVDNITPDKEVNKAVGFPSRRYRAGTSGIAYYQDIINRLQPFELRWPYSMKTFEIMKNDDAVATVLNLHYILVETAFTNWKIKYNKKSSKSKKAAELLEWNLNNLEGQSFLQVVKNVETFKEKGFSIVEKIYEEVKVGEHAGKWKIKKLANRPQLSLDESTPFEISAGGRDIKAIRQNTQYFQNKFNNNLFINPADINGSGYTRIPRKKFILFGDGATDSTPFGTPILRACYKAWKEKVMLEDLEVNGASKDLAGIIELAVPTDILEKASNDPSSPEAEMLDQMMKDAANIHAGEQPYFIRPSDLQDGSSSVSDYSLKLLGIDGAGRQFNTSELIQKRRKAIFDVFGAGHALTGEGSVSYNSAEVKSATHMYYIKRDIKVIEDGFNNDLIPELLNVYNEMGLSYKDMPRIVAGDIDKISYDEAGKLIQRAKSVNGLALTKENILRMHEMQGYDIDHMEHMTQEELFELMESGSKGSSRAGESKGTSGTGESQSAQGGNLNMENKSFNNLRIDAKGLYQMKEDGSREYIELSELPEELREGFDIT